MNHVLPHVEIQQTSNMDRICKHTFDISTSQNTCYFFHNLQIHVTPRHAPSKVRVHTIRDGIKK